MSERNPSKQRRAAQNKAAREALSTRTTKARQQPTRAEPDAKDRNDRAGRPGSTRGKTSQRPGRSAESPAAQPRGSRPVKGRDGRPARTADAVAVRQTNNPVSRAIAEVQAVPGGKGVFFALLFSIVSAGLIMFARVAPFEVMRIPGALVNSVRKANEIKIPAGLADQKPQIDSDFALVVFGPIAYLIAFIPVLITGGVFALARQPNSRRNFTLGAGAMFLFVIGLAGPLSIYFLFSFGGLVYAAYKARQADPPARAASLPSRRRRRSADEDEPEDVA